LPTRFAKIDPNSYYEWIKKWDEETISKYCLEKFGKDAEIFAKVSVEQTREIQKWAKELIENNSPDTIYAIHSVFTDIIWQTFYRSGNSSIYFANYHELLLAPADVHTIKNISKGFDYTENGEINFLKNGKVVAQISEASNLFFRILHDEYIRDEEYSHSFIRDVNKDITIKIWTEKHEQYGHELEDFIEILLFVTSTEIGLNFRRYLFEELEKNVGKNNVYEIVTKNTGVELTPIRFFNLSNHTSSPRLKYLSFYQALEFFYLDDKSIIISDKIKELQGENGNISIDSVNELSKVLNCYSSEISNLKIVLGRRLDVQKFSEWIKLADNKKYLCKNDKYKFVDIIDVSNEKSIIDSLSNRIYKIRCSIAHSKKGHNQCSLEPFIDDFFIKQEIQLIKFVASEILKNNMESVNN
jgi:hypothetical protein